MERRRQPAAILVTILVTLLAAAVLAENSYMLIVPRDLRPGTPMDITVNILNSTREVTVRALLFKDNSYELILSAEGNFNQGQIGTLTLNVPTIDHLPSSAKHFTLAIHGSGGLTFNDQSYLTYHEKDISVLVQTDKAIYKPGQTVQFRVLAVYSNMTIYDGPFDVVITDPNANKIKQWLGVSDASGVFDSNMVMDSEPVLGDWAINVAAPGVKSEKIFTVAKYVLPKFEVDLDIPSYAHTSDSDIQGKVKAKYTYGKPVKGRCVLAVRLDYFMPMWGIDGNDIIAEQTFDINGEASFTIPLGAIHQLLPHSYQPMSTVLGGHHVIVDVNVTEEINQLTTADSKTVVLHSDPIKVEFLPSCSPVFKPGLPYRASVKVGGHDDRPIKHHRSNVTLTTFITYRVYRDTGRLGKFYEKAFSLPEAVYSVPDSGVMDININIPNNASSVQLQATYGEVKAYKHLSKAPSRNGSYIHMTLKTAVVKVGSKITCEVKSTQPLPLLTYQVVSRGLVVLTGSADGGKKTATEFSFVVTKEMGPEAYVYVFYTNNDVEIVADGIKVPVSDIFQNRVTLGFETSSAQPGNSVNLHVIADPQSHVNLLAVDQSVLLLKEGNDITQSTVTEELRTYTPQRNNYWMCAEGSSECMFNKAGVWVITDVKGFQLPSYQRIFGGKDKCIQRPPIPMTSRGNPWANPTTNFGLSGIHPLAAMAGQFVEGLRGSIIGQTVGQLGANMFGYGGGYDDMSDSFAQPGQYSGPMSPGAPAQVPQVFSKSFQQHSRPQTEAASVEVKQVRRIRQMFPETWLWTNRTTGSDGRVVISTTVPDTITTWVASAFAVNKVSGLGISDQAAELRTFRPFFVTLNLPYSVIRGEDLAIQANVFNYLKVDVQVIVTLRTSNDFVSSGPDGIASNANHYRKNVFIEAGQAKSVYFTILPTTVGKIDIAVQAQSSLAADAVRRQLLVEPEGVAKELNIPTIIDLKNSTTFTKSVPIGLPTGVVENSEKLSLTAMGDILGPSIKGLSNLLRMPRGSGEQTMVAFAPNVYIADYLSATNQLTNEIKGKLLRYLEKGYQNELTYIHRDGSFSAFGPRDGSGSIWLTASVLKSFSQAKRYVYIDDEIIDNAEKWLLKQQVWEGNFHSQKYPAPSMLKGGPEDNSVVLTAHVFIALHEKWLSKQYSTTPLREIKIEYVNGTRSGEAKAYLERQVSRLNDPYELAITSYALALANSNYAAMALKKLHEMSVIKDGKRFWQAIEEKRVPFFPGRQTDPFQNDFSPFSLLDFWSNGLGDSRKRRSTWIPPHEDTKPVDIEIASYALLTYAYNKDFISGRPVMKWMLSKRNPSGGFRSMKDTIVGLEALSKFASMSSETVDIRATVTSATPFTHRFNINDQNSMVLQSVMVASVPNEITIDASGHGIALVEAALFFHVDREIQDPSFSLKIELKKETVNFITINICTSWLKQGSSGLTVMELGVPSGFEPDIISTGYIKGLKKIEPKERKVIMYFDKIERIQQTCFSMDMFRVDMVGKSQPTPIFVYDYYAPENQATAFYQSELLKNSSVCALCKECC